MRPVMCVLLAVVALLAAAPSELLSAEMPRMQGWFGRRVQPSPQPVPFDPCANGQCAGRRCDFRRPIDVDSSVTITVPPVAPPPPRVEMPSPPIVVPPAFPVVEPRQPSAETKLGVTLAIFGLAATAAVAIGFKRRAVAKQKG